MRSTTLVCIYSRLIFKTTNSHFFLKNTFCFEIIFEASRWIVVSFDNCNQMEGQLRWVRFNHHWTIKLRYNHQWTVWRMIRHFLSFDIVAEENFNMKVRAEQKVDHGFLGRAKVKRHYDSREYGSFFRTRIAPKVFKFSYYMRCSFFN